MKIWMYLIVVCIMSVYEILYGDLLSIKSFIRVSRVSSLPEESAMVTLIKPSETDQMKLAMRKIGKETLLEFFICYLGRDKVFF